MNLFSSAADGGTVLVVHNYVKGVFALEVVVLFLKVFTPST